jgi:hypothetical protein
MGFAMIGEALHNPILTDAEKNLAVFRTIVYICKRWDQHTLQRIEAGEISQGMLMLLRKKLFFGNL